MYCLIGELMVFQERTRASLGGAGLSVPIELGTEGRGGSHVQGLTKPQREFKASLDNVVRWVARCPSVCEAFCSVLAA